MDSSPSFLLTARVLALRRPLLRRNDREQDLREAGLAPQLRLLDVGTPVPLAFGGGWAVDVPVEVDLDAVDQLSCGLVRVVENQDQVAERRSPLPGLGEELADRGGIEPACKDTRLLGLLGRLEPLDGGVFVDPIMVLQL